jgi:Tol biopolymer transport system component
MKKIIFFLILVSAIIIPVLAFDSANKIVYEKDGIIFLINSDGKNEVRLIEGYNPIWSPDGKKILYLTKRPDSSSFGMGISSEMVGNDVNVINTDGSGKVTILKDIAFVIRGDDPPQISYSPEGKIAFSYYRVCKGDECEILGSATDDNEKVKKINTEKEFQEYHFFKSGHIGIIDDTGRNFLHLTNTSDVFYMGEFESGNCYLGNYEDHSAGQPHECTRIESNPIFSPDGKKIVYNGVGGITIKNSDGSNPVIILNNENPFLEGWSPDGKSILLTIYDKGQTNIYSMQSDGTGLTKLRGGASPKWSPDGKIIAYKDGGLWTINGDGTEAKNILKETGSSYEQSFSWSPDSKKIVKTGVERAPDEVSGLVLVNLTGGVEKINDAGGNDPKFSPISSTGSGSLPGFGNSGQSSSNSKQSPGFGGIIAIGGLIGSMILCSFPFKKNL